MPRRQTAPEQKKIDLGRADVMVLYEYWCRGSTCSVVYERERCLHDHYRIATTLA
jgi:hypothetical protein